MNIWGSGNNIPSMIWLQGLNFALHCIPPALMLTGFVEAGWFFIRWESHEVVMMRWRNSSIRETSLDRIWASGRELSWLDWRKFVLIIGKIGRRMGLVSWPARRRRLMGDWWFIWGRRRRGWWWVKERLVEWRIRNMATEWIW